MGVVDHADASGDHVFGDVHTADHILVAGLVVIALVIDRADDVDPALAEQAGGAALRQGGVQVMSDAVILDHRAVGIGASVQARAVAVGGDMVAGQAGDDDAVGELARGAEQDHLFVNGGRVPFAVGAGPQGEPRQPGGGECTGFYLHARGLHLHGGDDAEADEVFEHAGEGGEFVHGADGGVARMRVQLNLFVLCCATSMACCHRLSTASVLKPPSLN